MREDLPPVRSHQDYAARKVESALRFRLPLLPDQHLIPDMRGHRNAIMADVQLSHSIAAFLEAHLPARGNLEFGKTCFVGEHHCASIRAESKALSIQRTIPRSDGSLQEYAAFGDVPDSQTILYDRAKGRSVGADGYRTWTSKSHLRQPGSQIQR